MRTILPSLAIVCAALLWSLDGLLRQKLHLTSPIIIVGLEHIIGSLLFLPIIFKSFSELKKIKKRGWLSIIWISVFGGILGTYFYTKALGYVEYIDLSVVVLIQKLQPIFAIFLSSLILKEKLSNRFLILASFAILGGYFVTFGNNSNVSWDNKSLVASLYALLASLCWGSSTVIGKTALNYLSFKIVTGLRLLSTALICLVIIITTSKTGELYYLSIKNYYLIILIVFSSGAFALSIYYYGLERLPASQTTIYELAWPLSAVFLDYALKGKTLNIMQLLGAIVLLSSMILLTKEGRNDQFWHKRT